MFNSTDLEQLDLSNVYPTDDLVAIAQANHRHRSNYSIDNLYSTSTFYLENTNLTLKEQIAIEIYERNGPVRDELGTALSLSIIYSLILFTGVIGNLATCIVIVRNKYMHTSVNYYLFSLACSDLLLLILGLPQEIYMLWQRYPYIFGEQFCILRAFTSETSTNASILTITAFTIERYLAICHPLKVQTMSQLSRAIKAILIIWAIAAICSIPTAAQLGIVLQTLNTTGEILPQTAQCVIKNPLQNSFEISALCFFILPMVVISCLYVLIGLALRRSSSISNTNSSASHYHSPHHSCNQTNLNTKTNQQRNNNSIVLDNNSSPTTLIYNDKSVTFFTGLDKQQNRKNSILNENIDLKQPLMDKRQHKLNLDNFVNKENQFKKDKDNLSNRNSPTLKQQFNNQLKPSFEDEELIELNNNNQNFNKPSSLFLNINNGSSLTAHRSSDLLTATAATTNINNSTSINSITNNNLNQNSSILTPTTQAVTISATGNSIHHRHHSQATSRRSVIKMLVAVVVSFFICWSPFHAQRIMASHIERDSPELLILIYRLLTYVSAITYYLTATINPMLYQLMSIKFRLAFKETFGFWVLRPKSKNPHHSSIGNTAVGPTAAQQAALNQTTTAITYDQPSNNQTTIYNFESSNTVASNMSNSNSLQNNLKNSFQNSLQNGIQNSLKNGFQNGSKNNCSQNGSQKNISSTNIPNSNSGNIKKNNSQNNIIIENAFTNSTTNGDNSLKERSNKISDQPSSIHLDVNSTWINKFEKEKSQTESNENTSSKLFKQQQNKIINCNSTLNGSNSSNNLNNDLSIRNDNLKDNPIMNTCLNESNGQNCINV